MSDRFFLDTSYVLALLDRNDQYHEKATQLEERVRSANQVVITEAILLEIGNSLSAVDHRAAAVEFISACYDGSSPNLHVVPTNTDLIKRSLDLFKDRHDKTWSLTDCMSFLIMSEMQVRDAVSADNHFVQASYRALMIED